MRKSLWIIPFLFAAIAVPYANADSITDPSVITKFKCCDGAKVPIHDLEITFNAPITGFIDNLGLDCTTKGVGTGTVAVTCRNAIPVGDIVVTSETSDGKFLFAFWTDANGAKVATATIVTPTPEPATGGLMLLGIGVLLITRKRIGARVSAVPEQ
jgi:PEP-CTERM motif